MVYELIDTDGVNHIGAYDTEEDALMELRASVAIIGYDYTSTIALVTASGDDDIQLIASGIELARRVEISEMAAFTG
jgi:hypothetical protein